MAAISTLAAPRLYLQAPGGWIHLPFWLVALSIGLLITGGIVYLIERCLEDDA